MKKAKLASLGLVLYLAFCGCPAVCPSNGGPRDLGCEDGLSEDFKLWNRFVSYLSSTEFNSFATERESLALVFWYESEVQNGGHLQYFENWGVKHAEAAVVALEAIGCSEHALILKEAIGRYGETDGEPIRSKSEYVEAALQGDLDESDKRFHEAKQGLIDTLERYLTENKAKYEKSL